MNIIQNVYILTGHMYSDTAVTLRFVLTRLCSVLSLVTISIRSSFGYDIVLWNEVFFVIKFL